MGPKAYKRIVEEVERDTKSRDICVERKMLGSLKLISHFMSITPRKKLPFLQKKIKQIKKALKHMDLTYLDFVYM